MGVVLEEWKRKWKLLLYIGVKVRDLGVGIGFRVQVLGCRFCGVGFEV